jgi:hypothetical protein
MDIIILFLGTKDEVRARALFPMVLNLNLLLMAPSRPYTDVFIMTVGRRGPWLYYLYTHLASHDFVAKLLVVSIICVTSIEIDASGTVLVSVSS